MVICPRCGQQNPAESRFCSQCGTQLDGASLASPAASADETSAGAAESVDEPDLTATAADAVADEPGQGGDAGPTVSEQLQPGSALLVVKRGPNAGSRYLLDSDVTTAGRHPDSDIFLDDVTVSRRHAEFHREGAEFTVRDVGSLNGTYVNRERIDAAGLSGGDEVQIGKFRLVFVGGAAGARAEDAEQRGAS